MTGDRIPFLRAIESFMEAKAVHDRAQAEGLDSTPARLAEVKAANHLFDVLDEYIDQRIKAAKVEQKCACSGAKPC